ncbi:MAG: phosphatidylglycerol lysyltransferase domain-containing protein [Clostridiales bacterium]|nr:phosphatidylglycerol lysyltransferase domain-containing protein [Clostridiales bacterium]
MLNFNEPNIEDKNWVTKCFSYSKSMSCEYTFGNVYLWHVAYRTKIAHFKGFLICRWGKDNDISYSLPIGNGDFKEAVNEIIKDAENLGVKAKIYGVTQSYKEMLNEFFPGKFDYFYDDGNNDYIYRAEDLANLSGKKYHSKRNHITNFKKDNPNWSFEEIDENNISECIDLHTNWIEEKDENDSDYSLEFEAVLTGFENYEKLGLTGGLIRVNSKPIAYTYGEKLSDKCFVTHFEKAPASIQGAYAIINQEFAKILLKRGYEFINREEDLGIED